VPKRAARSVPDREAEWVAEGLAVPEASKHPTAPPKARRGATKRTHPPKGLTAIEERFALGMFGGHTRAEAYRLANPKSKHWKVASLYTKASELMATERLQARVAALQRELVAQALWSREESVKALRAVIEHPDRSSDIVAAVKELNAMHGYHAPQRVEHSGAVGAIERRIIDVGAAVRERVPEAEPAVLDVVPLAPALPR